MQAKMYGIRNCDTVKKARAWIDERDIDVEFHDFRVEGVGNAQLARWLKRADWETLLNRRGLTWRRLPQRTRAAVTDAASAAALMLELPAIIKRPVLECGAQLVVGFDAERYASVFGLRA